jgi:hypothetical protein
MLRVFAIIAELLPVLLAIGAVFMGVKWLWDRPAARRRR